MLYEVYISSEWKTLNFVIQYYAISCLSNQIVCLAGQVLDSFRYVFHINFFLYVILIDILLLLSGNYGGALGANALAKGLEGNKSLRVCKFSVFFFFYNSLYSTWVQLRSYMFHFVYMEYST